MPDIRGETLDVPYASTLPDRRRRLPTHVPLLCVTGESRRDDEGRVFSFFPGDTECSRALETYAVAHGLGRPVVVGADVSDNTTKTWRDKGVKAVLLSGLEPGPAGFGARARALGWNPGNCGSNVRLLWRTMLRRLSRSRCRWRCCRRTRWRTTVFGLSGTICPRRICAGNWPCCPRPGCWARR